MEIDERADVVRQAREFFYVDLQRVRSYYAQLNRGVVETVLLRDKGEKGGEAAAQFLGLSATGRLGASAEREESRSMQDLNFVVLEELLEREGLIAEVPSIVSDPEAWRSGAVQEQVHEGQIVKFTGAIQILDPRFFAGRVEQLERLARAFTAFAPALEPPSAAAVQRSRKGGPTPAKPKSNVKEDAALAAMLGFEPAMLRSMSELIAAFTSDTIQLRVLPAGLDSPDCHFGGSLLGRSEYIQEEREALFSRYGTRLDDWTVVMQLARIPERTTDSPPVQSEYARPTNRVDRAALEGMALQFVQMMERTGVAEGPVWPAVSVTPLAMYRQFA